MNSRIKHRKYFFICYLSTILIIASCSSEKQILLYNKMNNSNAKVALINIGIIYVAINDKILQQSENSIIYMTYDTPEKENVWISSIDGFPINNFLEIGEDPMEINSYQLLPGKHTIEIMYQSTGKTIKHVNGPTDEIRGIISMRGANINVSFVSSYTNKLTQPLSINLEINAGETYVLNAIIQRGKCEIKVLRVTKEKINNRIGIMKKTIASEIGECNF